MLDYFDTTTQLLISVLVTIFLGWYLYYQYCFTYWKRRGVPTLPPTFPTGNLGTTLLGAENIFVRLQKYYTYFKDKGYRHAGLYFFKGPIYFPIDVKIVKGILVTDFEHFVDRGMHYDEENYPLSANLVAIPGNKWRTLRAKLTPTFSSGKLKGIFESVFLRNTENLIKHLEIMAKKGKEINTKEVLSCFTTDIIGSSALGIEVNSLENPDSEVCHIVNTIFYPSLWIRLKTILIEGFSNPGMMMKSFHDNPKAERWITDVVRETMKYREENKVVRNDFFNLLLEIKKDVGLTWNEMIGQAFIFFVAGFDTSSTTMSNCLHELSHNQDLQDKLREEVHKTLGTDVSKYTYEGISSLTYLDYVVKETLRLYPVTGFLTRICVKDYTVPDTGVLIEKGTMVIISTLGLQKDPEYFPEPLRFNPDRFRYDNIVPYSNIPFGEGPRMCLGMRYGLLQAKLGLAAIIAKNKILPSNKTPRILEYEKIPATPALTIEGGMYIGLQTL